MTTTPPPSILCPLDNVRITSAQIMTQATSVRIVPEKIEAEADLIAEKYRLKKQQDEQKGENNNNNNNNEEKKEETIIPANVLPGDIEWNHEQVHYTNGSDDTKVTGLFVLDALNFCFWPDSSWEYDRLAGSLKCCLTADDTALSSARLARMTVPALREILGGDLPQMEERVRLLREVGEELTASFGGSVVNLINAANHSASNLVKLILKHFPGFRDTAIWKGRQVFFYKRAQIFVGDVWGAFGGKGLGYFSDISKLTTFPDYRVPQLLRDLDILEYSADLAGKVDHLIEIEPGSTEEIEIRAATIQAVEQLKAALEKRNISRTSIEIDWDLWQRGEAQRKTLRPHHRVLTIFY